MYLNVYYGAKPWAGTVKSTMFFVIHDYQDEQQDFVKYRVTLSIGIIHDGPYRV